jgi:hypothetical protein|tara:strand:- start:1 stop:237 length:237 start_codon:yes stop_codon:yes gene_type:complete
MARPKDEIIEKERLLYDVSLYNAEHNISCVYKKASLDFLIQSLKKLDTKTKENAKAGSMVIGKTKNSKNTRPLPNDCL